MIANDIQNAKDILLIAETFKKENKEELLLLVASCEKLDNVRKELEEEKKKYRKSFYPIFKENFRAEIYIPTHFKIEIGSFKIEKGQDCSFQTTNPKIDTY